MSQEQAVHPIIVKQENGEVVLKLVLENPKQETQALTLANPQDNKVYLDLNHSTDWVAIIVSILSFAVTIIIVRKSTQQQIQTNRDLIVTQKELKTQEIYSEHKQKWIDDLRAIVSSYLAKASLFQHKLNHISHMYEEKNFVNMVYDKNSAEHVTYNELQELFYEIYNYSLKLRTYLHPSLDQYKLVLEKENLFLAKIPKLMSLVSIGSKKALHVELNGYIFLKKELTELLIEKILEYDLGVK